MNKPRLFSLSYEGTSRTQGMSVCFLGCPRMEVEFSQEKTQASLGLNSWFLTCFFFPVPKGNGWIASLSFFNLHDRYLIFSNLLFLQDTFLFLWIFYFFDTHTHLVFFGLGVQWVALCGVPAWVWPHARPSPTENPDGDLFYLFSSPGKFEGFWQTTNLTR